MASVVNLPIVSSSVLSVVNSMQPVFQPMPVLDTRFYDEGPRVINVRKPSPTDIETSLGNLSSSYAWTQGVEMNKQAMYDAGLVKIWSGEAGHQLKPNTFGQDKNFFPDPGFADLDLFIPLRFLQSQEMDSPLWWNIITFPIITGDNDQLENFNFNGIIEPFPIRPVVAFFSTDVPFEARMPRASLVGGNDNIVNGSDRVLTVDYYSPTQQIVGYLDMVDVINPGTEMSGTWSSGSWSGGVPYSGSFIGSGVFTPIEVPTGITLNGFFRYEFTTILPFVDQRLDRNTTLNDGIMISDAEIVNAMAHMSGNTDNYVRYDQRSACCGWDYDNNAAIGTDSLPFGGMTY